MNVKLQKIAHNFLWKSLIAFFVLMGLTLVANPQYVRAGAVGFFLSFLFVSSNFFVIKHIKGENSSTFLTRFYLLLGVRFILVLVALVLILTTTKIHQIYFTVSFIISYIFHSLIEVILINKLLETDN